MSPLMLRSSQWLAREMVVDWGRGFSPRIGRYLKVPASCMGRVAGPRPFYLPQRFERSATCQSIDLSAHPIDVRLRDASAFSLCLFCRPDAAAILEGTGRYSPTPSRAINAIQRFGRLLTGENIIVHLIHVGNSVPPVNAAVPALPAVILRSGNVVKSIVDAAVEDDVDFIGMPTAGHHGVLDALRGSTTERHAPCPVFAVPAALPRGSSS